MRIKEKGHIYLLDHIDGPGSETLTFVNRESGTEHPGTQTQEVLRALIDRTMHCDNCLPTPLDSEIVYHLRMALVIHEARALIRKTQKGRIEPENVATCSNDGHFRLDSNTLTSDSVLWVGRKR